MTRRWPVLWITLAVDLWQSGPSFLCFFCSEYDITWLYNLWSLQVIGIVCIMLYYASCAVVMLAYYLLPRGIHLAEWGCALQCIVFDNCVCVCCDCVFLVEASSTMFYLQQWSRSNIYLIRLNSFQKTLLLPHNHGTCRPLGSYRLD